MKKNNFFLLVSIGMLFFLSACGGEHPDPVSSGTENQMETIALTVWGAEEDETLLQEIFASFQNLSLIHI